MKNRKSRNPDRKVNVAVVGLGFMGVTHIKAYRQLKAARIAAVCDAFRVPVNGILPGVSGNITGSDAMDLGRAVKVYRALDEVLADSGVDLVDLCVPTALHPEQAIAALKAGKHVICEKPLALNSARAREIARAAQSARGFFMPAMCMRFWPGWSCLKQIVADKPYGRICSASFRRLSPAPGWSKATYSRGDLTGGALLDLHIHDTDFVQFLFGRPASVFSSGVTRNGNSIDHVVTQYHYPRGPVVYAEGTWLLTGGFNMAYTVICERATLDFDLARGAQALRISEAGKASRFVKSDGSDGYVGELRYMLEAIQSGKRPKVVTAQDGLSAVQICEAEAKSVRTGKVVVI
ncbi:MAG TPA: Gfo/Idh/MocA family oxidoreductase [Candidatus Paceibacterota bacterium]|nr:Gfo/Idh/MocA family oxidoreductase [Verrucomicrobiota bacterium]HSA09012.1 Gfo/Idh/MocA family oxidoreductase [Candidatus Paceibacterota bacterium]